MLLTILVIFVLCFMLERMVPGWKLPHVRTWPLRVLLINGVQLSVILTAGISWERWLSSWSVFHLSQHVAPAVGGLMAYFVATFVFYWWHRWRHEYGILWRGFHQIHHSPQRLEVITLISPRILGHPVKRLSAPRTIRETDTQALSADAFDCNRLRCIQTPAHAPFPV